MRRPASVTALGFLLILIAALLLFNAARNVLSYFESAEYEGVATRMSLAEYLLERPQETLLPPLIGVMAAIGGVGAFRGRRWTRPVAVAVGVATVLGGAFLVMIALSELGIPGSFAMLFLPPAVLAVAMGAFIVYAALVNGAYLNRQGPT